MMMTAEEIALMMISKTIQIKLRTIVMERILMMAKKIHLKLQKVLDRILVIEESIEVELRKRAQWILLIVEKI